MKINRLIVLIAMFLILSLKVAIATTIHVTNTNDSGPGSLRAAITTANWNGEADTIVFDVSGTITLTSGPLWIGNESGTTIDASGNIVIDASNVDNAFQIASNGNTIKNLKIQGAKQDGIYITGSSNKIDGVEITGTSPGSTYYAAIDVVSGNENKIQNCNIHDNDGYGIWVQNGATNTQITGNEIYNNGKAHVGNFAPSGIIVEHYGTDGTVIDGNDIYSNDGNGIYVLGGASAGPANTVIQNNEIHDNSFDPIDGVGILIQGAVEGNPSVHIYNNDIYDNYAQGVLIEQGNGGSPTYVKVENNKIYSNGQEGVLIRDPGTDYNTVVNNLIGTDDDSGTWPTVKPNGNSGLAITNGAQYNDIQGNTICYNRYQDVLISGSGTSHNTVTICTILGGAYTSPHVGYDNTGVIIIDDATDNTVGPGNTIQYHTYGGIQIVGGGTDNNQVVNNGAAGGGEISYNGGGIAVMNTYPDVAHGYDPQLGPTTSGPAGTRIEFNNIVNNYGDGIFLRRIAPRSDGVTTISNNQIKNNGAIGADLGNGIHCIGSSPDITGNTITGNHENGIRLAVYFGSDDSPSTYDDDVLSDGTTMDISGNTIEKNGLEVVGNDIGAGIYAIDTPLGDISSIYNANTWNGNDDVCHIQQDWYGYAKVVDQDGNGISGLTVIVEQGGDASGWGWTYTFTTYDANGNYGPSGFDVNSERTYQKIVEKRVKNDGTTESYTPQLVYIQGTEYKAEYAFNGKYPDPSEEVGGAIESPPNSGWDRYQYAKLTKLSPSPYAGKVVINEVLYRQTDGTSADKNDEFIELYFTDTVNVSGWRISDGNIIDGDTDGSLGTFVFSFPDVTFHAGDYVVIWIGSSNDPLGLKNAPSAAAQYYVGKRVMLNNNGDDIWLFDADGKIVDYMAYGNDAAINDQSYLPSGFWTNNAPYVDQRGQSLSLTPNGQDTNSGNHWEPTTSGIAQGPITRDTDDLSYGNYNRISSAGKNNNGIDFGDAPSSYGDAGSTVDTTIYMGSMPDYEDSSQYSVNADGDDTNGIDDEELTSFPTLTTTTTTYSIRVNVTNNAGNAYLRGWIDFDRNGTFDADEASDLKTISNGYSGTVSLTWSSIPNDITEGKTYIRLRLSTESLSESDATGIKGIGEVEDYNITIILAGTTISITKIDNPDPVYPNRYLNYTIKINNTGSEIAKNTSVKDFLDENVTYISSNPSGNYYSSNHTIVWNVGDLNPSESKTFIINVSVNSVKNGTILHNHAIVSASNAYNETTQNTTVLAAEIYDPKTVFDLNGLPTQPGDILEYSIWINNTGSLDTIAKLVDPIPEHTSYANYVWSSSGTAYYNASNNSIEWFGSVPAGGKLNVKFRVKIDAPLQDTIISNQGIVYYDSNNDSIIDSAKPTDDPNTNEAYDPTNITVKNPKVELIKTSTKAEYGKNVTFTIKLCVEGYITNVTLIEHYPPKLRFIEATIPPTKGNNIWFFKKLQDECVEIKIKMFIPAYYYELEMNGGVKGKGIVLANKEFYTGIKPMDIVNRVMLTCDQGIKKESKVLVTIREKKGNFASISEHGIGNYSSDESIKVKRRIIYVKKSVDANNSTWSVNYCLKNRYGDFIRKNVYGTRIEDVTNAKSSTPRIDSETKVNGSYLLKVVSDFKICEKYSGNFEVNERIDGDADINVNGSGIGIFEEIAGSHAMFERGIGDYSSKTYFNELYFDKRTDAKDYYQKVCYFNNSNYVSTTTEGDYLTKIKGYTLLNYTLNSTVNGTSKFKVKINGIDVEEWYAGRFNLKKNILTSYPKTTWIPDGKIGDGEYENKTTFNGFEIYWKSDEKYLYMAIKAKTKGWLRIGFEMCPCFNQSYDYVVGFVVDGKTKVLDMYYNGTLMLDKEICGYFGCGKQSISKFGGSENGYTTIEFKRRLDTKDVYDARLIKGKEINIAWAYGKDDDVWSDPVRSGYGKIVI